MPKVLIKPLTLLCVTLALPACVAEHLSVTAHPVACAALLPQSWRQPVSAPEFSGDGSAVGDWITYADAVTGRLDQANDRTTSAISIVQACEDRDRQAVTQATRHRFLGLF